MTADNRSDPSWCSAVEMGSSIAVILSDSAGPHLYLRDRGYKRSSVHVGLTDSIRVTAGAARQANWSIRSKSREKRRESRTHP
jgi:hypothetical protein